MLLRQNNPRPEGPENLSELGAAIFDSLVKIFGSRHRVPKTIRFNEHHQLAVLRADLPSLHKYGVRLGIEGGINKWLLMRVRNTAAIRIPISHFEADAILGKRWIEFKFRPALGQTRVLLPAAVHTSTGQAVDRLLKSADQPILRVFITRGMNALADLSEKSSPQAIEAANTATSDCGVLVRALADPETVINIAPTDDPIAAAKLRGVEARENLLRAEGGTFTALQVSKMLNISRQAVDKRRRAGQLIGLSRGRRGFAYPAWQFGDGETLPGLQAVLERLSRHDPWMQMIFMLHPYADLHGSTPLTELRAGHVDAVLTAAASYGEHGAA